MSGRHSSKKLREALRNYLLIAGIITLLALFTLHLGFINTVGAAGTPPSLVHAEHRGTDVYLSWVGVGNGFHIYRDNALIHTTTEAHYLDTMAPTTHTPVYKVITADAKLVGYASPSGEAHGSLAATWLDWWNFWK